MDSALNSEKAPQDEIKRVLVIGLDGVPLNIISQWAEEGHLPVLGDLMSRGQYGLLRSTVPPTSGPSWSSYLTGKHPGKTGIYDFLYRQPGSYYFPPVNTSHRDGESFFMTLSRAGFKVVMINIPISYPLEPVNGVAISGWMTPFAAKDFIRPPQLLEELRREVGEYHIYPMETFSEGRSEKYWEASYALLEMRTKSALHIMKRDRWDLFQVVYFDTDRILHQVWHYIDPAHPWRKRDNRDRSGEVIKYFHELDARIGQLIAAAGEGTLVFIISDHGMGPAHNFVVLNNWLLGEGFLHFKRNLWTNFKKLLWQNGFTLRNIHRIADRLGMAKIAEYRGGYNLDRILKQVFLSFLDVDWSRSTAYSFGRHLGSVYLNVKGREPQGIVEPGGEYQRVREEIIRRAQAFTHPQSGRPIIGEIYRGEEVYSGPHAAEAPDLILRPREETDIFFGLSDFGSNKLIDRVYRYPGMHRDDGLIIAAGPGIPAGGKIQGGVIVDLAPTILHVLGQLLPSDMDGRVLSQLFQADHWAGRSPEFAEMETGERPPGEDFTPEGQEEIIKRLKGLGYL